MGPSLSLVKREKLSFITILEIMRLQGSGGVSDGMKTARALLTVGHAVENKYKTEMCKRNHIAISLHARPSEFTGYFTGLGYKDLHARRITAEKYIEDSEEWTSEWTQVLRVPVLCKVLSAVYHQPEPEKSHGCYRSLVRRRQRFCIGHHSPSHTAHNPSILPRLNHQCFNLFEQDNFRISIT
jgi:hypothetical protein